MELKQEMVTAKRIYALKETNTMCDLESIIRTKEECEKGLAKLGKSTHIAYSGGPWGHVPAGCTYNPSHSHFNKNDSPGSAHNQMAPVCVTEKKPKSCAGAFCTVDECCGKKKTQKIYTMQEKNTKCAPESIIRTKEECEKALASIGKSSNIGYNGNWLTGHNVPAGCSENHFNTDFSADKTRGETSRNDACVVCS